MDSPRPGMASRQFPAFSNSSAVKFQSLFLRDRSRSEWNVPICSFYSLLPAHFLFQTAAHLLRGLVGEGDGRDLRQLHPPGFKQIGKPLHQRSGLAVPACDPPRPPVFRKTDRQRLFRDWAQRKMNAVEATVSALCKFSGSSPARKKAHPFRRRGGRYGKALSLSVS